MKYDETNVTRGVQENKENPGYFYAPCRECGKRLNVGNNPPVIIDGMLNVICYPKCPQKDIQDINITMSPAEVLAVADLMRTFQQLLIIIGCDDVMPPHIASGMGTLLKKVTHELTKQIRS